MKITSAFVKYNANSRDKSTGDCVIRALSLLYKQDYDKTKSELTRIAHEAGRGYKYNSSYVFKKYLDQLGYVEANTFKDTFPTVEELAKQFPDSALFAGVGNKPKVVTHAVALIDGDIYDSWHSEAQVVTYYYVIEKGSKSFTAQIAIEDVAEEVHTSLVEYCRKIEAKQPWQTVTVYGVEVQDQYTAEIDISWDLNDKIQDVPYFENFPRWIRPSYGEPYTAVVKINPRMSLEDNIKLNTRKNCERVREFVYQARKEVEDYIKQAALEPNPDFTGNKSLLMKCPDWAIPLITYASDLGHSSEDDGCRYEVHMDRLPDDPRYNDTVYFWADTLSELKNQFEQYKESFDRFGYDY